MDADAFGQDGIREASVWLERLPVNDACASSGGLQDGCGKPEPSDLPLVQQSGRPKLKYYVLDSYAHIDEDYVHVIRFEMPT